MRQRNHRSTALCVAGVLWCGFLVVCVLFMTAFSCFGDTAYCAESREKNGVYAGVLQDEGGSVLRDARLTVSFESRADEDPVRDFTTDARGRYCFVWANERSIPDIEARTGNATVPSHLTGPTANWRPLRGADPPAGCQTSAAGVPWLRADGASDSPEFVITLLLPMFAGAVMLLGLGRDRIGRFCRRIGTVLTLASTVLIFSL
ncbi:MAG TPA: hypothetical protein VN238_13890 [Solirubrobacteraceae bacterium]|nr:hypothetical protein [Solirubrobacteraceae bacterium]